jgi:hypothetical protein
MDVLFVASVSLISPDPAATRKLIIEGLGVSLQRASAEDEYHYAENLDGVKHFGVWPLYQAAEACFGTREWPADRVVPQVSIEFDLANAEKVAEAAHELESRGHQLLHAARTEPWGQTVARLQSPEGAIIGLSFTPTMH